MSCHRPHPRPAGTRRSDPIETLHRAPGMRASDAEREAVAGELQTHAAAGRLDMGELEQRLGAAYRASTRGELAAVLADLPARTPDPVAPRRSETHGGPHDVRVLLLVGLVLVAVWALTGAGAFWPGWVVGWWGLALLAKRPLRARARRGAGLRAG